MLHIGTSGHVTDLNGFPLLLLLLIVSRHLLCNPQTCASLTVFG